MATATEISYQAAAAACDAVVDLVDSHGTAAGFVEIRTGAIPANVEAAATGTLLATITLQDPAFGAASDQNPNARATLNGAPSDASADAAGTAGYFRVYIGGGTTGVIQGTAGLAGDTPDMTLNDKTFEVGGTVTITSYTITMPEA